MLYDLVIIGTGPGGYVAAIRAAQLGLSVAVVEKRDALGGTCLNIGCIPSKALLDSSEKFFRARRGFDEEGIKLRGVELDLGKMLQRKDKVVRQLTSGVAQLLKGRVKVFRGEGRVLSPGKVGISGSSENLDCRSILLATGSVSQELPFLPFDGDKIVSSTEALSFPSVPERLVVVGAGAIGLELGSVWSRLGSEVVVIEILPKILPGWDEQVSDTLKRALLKQGLSFELETRVLEGVKADKGVRLKAVDGAGGEKEFSADRVLVAVGRRPFTEGLGLDELGVASENGRLRVDRRFQTSVSGVYAIGDLVPGPMLAHKAEEEGIAVAENLAGFSGHVSYDTIPSIVYTWPEAASVGRTERELKDRSIPYKKGVFSFGANGRSLAMGEREGFFKVLAREETDEVVGAHAVGPWTSDLIMEAVTTMEFGGSAEDMARTSHPHPTLSEVVREAALAVDGRAIHKV